MFNFLTPKRSGTLDLSTPIHSYSSNEKLYLLDAKTLYNHTESWRHNRPASQKRVAEIEETIQNGTYVDNIIYLAEIIDENKKRSLVCYDGNHRREALRNSNGQRVLVNIIFNSSDEEIKQRFIILNQSNPVPELYTTETDNTELRSIIEDCVERLMIRFPKNVSASRNPRKPNFNRDKLTDELFEFVRDKHVVSLSGESLYNSTMKLNSVYESGKHISLDKISKSIVKKVKMTGCYLFLKDFRADLDISN